MHVARWLVILAIALGPGLRPASAAEVRVYVAAENGKTIYVGYMRAQLTVHVAGEDEPRQVKLRPVELEKGHRPASLDHDGILLHSVVEDEPTYYAEVVLQPPRKERASSHYHGFLVTPIAGAERAEGIELASAELRLDIRGEVRDFSVAPPGTILRWVSGLSYPLSTCVVSGEPFDPEMVPRLLHEGRTFLFCCGRCKRKVRDDPAPHLLALDRAIIAAQRPTYPLTTCPVSGDDLELAEAPADIVLSGNRLVRLSRVEHESAARKRAPAIIEQIDLAVVKAQLPDYPLEGCVVCDEPLGVEPVNYLLGTRLVRICCKDCIPALEVDPRQHLDRIDAAGAQEDD